MKTEDFMKALGGISQEKLDALAQWQEAKTPLTGKTTAQKADAQPAPEQRSRITMKQKTAKHTPVIQMFPWNIGIGAAIVACAVVAVSVGMEAVGQKNQMQVGTSLSEQSAASTEQFTAWYWTKYRGDDIALPDGKTVAVIRSASDGVSYLTQSGQQDQTELATYLSAEWLETGSEEFTDPVSNSVISTEGEAHDVIFIGIPAGEIPKNTLRWDYHNGTVTPSGKLHLDFNALTIEDAANEMLPEDARLSANENYYYFISVPDGCLPDITGYEVTFTEYHSDQVPDTQLYDESQYTDYLNSLPEAKNMLAASLGDKYIFRIPEEQPQTVRVTGARVQNAAGEHTALTFTPGEEYDTLEMAFPIDDMTVNTALTDLQVTADGVFSVTLNQYRENADNADATLTTDVSAVWTLKVPHNSLPEISRISYSSEYYYKNGAPSEEYDEYGFIGKAGQMLTITLPGSCGTAETE